jgi:hypothetical protein
MFWNKENDVGQLMRLFTMYMKFLNSLSNLGMAMSTQKTWFDKFINKIKLWYFVNWKYPRIQKFAMNSMSRYLKTVEKYPNRIIPVLLSFIEFLLTYAATAEKDTEEIIKRVFKENELTIQSNLDLDTTDENVVMDWFNVICRSTETFDSFENKYTITKANVNLLDGTCELTQTIYDCEDEFHAKTADLLKFKYIKIDGDGNISNPNYLLDSAIKEDDSNSFTNMTFHLIKMLSVMVLSLLELELGISMFFDQPTQK